MIYTATKLQKETAVFAGASLLCAAVTGVGGFAVSGISGENLGVQDQRRTFNLMNLDSNQDRPQQPQQGRDYPSEAITQQITGKGRQP